MKSPLNVDEAYIINDESAALLKKDLSDAEISDLTELVYNEEDGIKNRILNSFKDADGQFRQDFALSLVNGDIQDEVELLKQFEGKKLLVAGTNDSVLNLNYLRELETDALLESEFVFLENKGHCPHIEEPVKVASLIKKFVG